MIHLLTLLALASIVFSAFQLDLFVADWRVGDGVCTVHQSKMDTVIVHDLAGTIQFSPEYYDAKEQTFPNCGVEYPASLFGSRRGRIFVCPICEKNRRKWIDN